MIYQTKIERTLETDAAVCGGGFSGFAAAYAAARAGSRVLLIERNECLGGVGTQGLVNQILGVRAKNGEGYRTCVGGIFAAVERRLLETGDAIDVKTVDLNLCPHGWKKTLGLGLTFQNERMKLLLEQMLSEVGAQILYATDIIDVTTEGNRITGLIVHNKSGLSYVSAKVYIDATGDGDICAMAGNPFDFGDEEGGLAAASLEMHVDHVDKAELTAYMRETNDIRFKAIISRLKEEGIWKFPYEIFISVNLTRDDVFMINTIRQVGINGVDAESLTRGVVTGRSENFALLDVMRTYFPGFRNAEIRQIAPVIGIRETRRVRCCYTLRVSDLIEGKTFPDSVAVSGYGWDMPNPKAPSRQPFEKVARKSPFAEIPYRCLLPEKTDNLIAVGRCIGAEREALGVVRVMGPCIAMGEAAGIAAHLARQTDCNFKRVDVSVLRQEIMRQGGIPDSAHVPD